MTIHNIRTYNGTNEIILYFVFNHAHYYYNTHVHIIKYRYLLSVL